MRKYIFCENTNFFLFIILVTTLILILINLENERNPQPKYSTPPYLELIEKEEVIEEFIIQPRDCVGETKLLIAIKSLPTSVSRRDAIRRTWANNKNFKGNYQSFILNLVLIN